MAILTAGYTFMCIVRAVFPVDVNRRICFASTYFTPIMDRSMATVGELMFVTGLVEFTRHSANLLSIPQPMLVNVCTPMIVLAQLYCWAACVTRNSWWNAIEEFLWAASICTLTVVWTNICKQAESNGHRLSAHTAGMLFKVIASALFYLNYMLSFNIPMYLKLGEAELAAGTHATNMRQSLVEMTTCTLDQRDAMWEDERNWRFMYFVGGPSVMIALVGWQQKLCTLDKLY